MRNVGNRIAALALISFFAVQPALAQDTASPMVPPKAPREMPDNVKTAWACVAGGSAGTVAALAAGAENLINVVAGGMVVPANRSVMVIGLAGVVFTTFCTLGQQLLPLAQYYLGGDDDAPTTYPQPDSAISSDKHIKSFTAAELPQTR